MRKYAYTYLLPINRIAYFRQIVKRSEHEICPAQSDIHLPRAGGNGDILCLVVSLMMALMPN